MTKLRLFHQGVLGFVIGLAIFSSGVAFASQTGLITTDAPPAVSAGVVAWGSITALACTFLMNLTTPGTPTPWNWNPQVRWALALAATVVSGVVHSLQTGVTVQTALVTAAAALLTATLAHFSTPGAMAKAVPQVAGAAVLMLGIAFSSTGCAGTFDQLVAGSPSTVVNAFEQAAGVVNSGAEVLFPVVLAQLPPAQQATAQADFTKAEATYQSAMTALNAGVAAYQASQGTPNWSALISDGIQAVDAVIAAIDTWGGSVPPLPGARVALLAPSYMTARANLTPALNVVHAYRKP